MASANLEETLSSLKRKLEGELRQAHGAVELLTAQLNSLSVLAGDTGKTQGDDEEPRRAVQGVDEFVLPTLMRFGRAGSPGTPPLTSRQETRELRGNAHSYIDNAGRIMLKALVRGMRMHEPFQKYFNPINLRRSTKAIKFHLKQVVERRDIPTNLIDTLLKLNISMDHLDDAEIEGLYRHDPPLAGPC